MVLGEHIACLYESNLADAHWIDLTDIIRGIRIFYPRWRDQISRCQLVAVATKASTGRTAAVIRTDSWDARGKSLGHFLTASVAQRLCSSLRHAAFSFEN